MLLIQRHWRQRVALWREIDQAMDREEFEQRKREAKARLAAREEEELEEERAKRAAKALKRAKLVADAGVAANDWLQLRDFCASRIQAAWRRTLAVRAARRIRRRIAKKACYKRRKERRALRRQEACDDAVSEPQTGSETPVFIVPAALGRQRLVSCKGAPATRIQAHWRGRSVRLTSPLWPKSQPPPSAPVSAASSPSLTAPTGPVGNCHQPVLPLTAVFGPDGDRPLRMRRMTIIDETPSDEGEGPCGSDAELARGCALEEVHGAALAAVVERNVATARAFRQLEADLRIQGIRVASGAGTGGRQRALAREQRRRERIVDRLWQDMRGGGGAEERGRG